MARTCPRPVDLPQGDGDDALLDFNRNLEGPMFKTILVPVDVEDIEVARPAIEKALKLAEASGAAVRLLNVVMTIPASYTDFIPDNYEEEAREACEAKLKDIASKLPLSAERLSWKARSGGVYPEILAEAEEWGADLIVLGSHRPSMATYFLGSNAKTVARHAKCSVLIVRE
jgi:nucleotide-binding universal stress UspA family protein